jgi:hypothetical protein
VFYNLPGQSSPTAIFWAPHCAGFCASIEQPGLGFRYTQLSPRFAIYWILPDNYVRFGPKPDIAHYSITSSARASRVGGTVSASALAVLRLITS